MAVPPQHSSLLPLEGGINFRDLGGYRVTDGRYVKSGMLFRSGALANLSTTDCQLLAQLPVRYVLDYRDGDEVAAKPNVLWPGVAYHHIPANPLSQEVNANLDKLTNEWLAGFDGQRFMLELYRRLPFNNPGYHQLVQLLLAMESGAIVQHCAVGKDRTGCGSALVLLALGADEATVMEDYLLTETTLSHFRNSLLAQLGERFNAHAMAQFRYIFSAREEFLQTALNTITNQYGSTDSWLMAEYGLGHAEREQLQQFYLETRHV
ncbi:tyrosine-protein phosphatase [Serratia microhaemolytica]|uniref:tyrosine-protein phosphatase n=1 Tax=Serratia microhaemolytica TaxID=2675110 RepID=UPI000FDDE382|nr:tyrosine-protein phosphatase [Serratia microhaemolytica]